MSRIVFLIGGAGNVFFELVKLSRTGHEFVTSDFFIRSRVRKLLKHTDHPRVHGELFSHKKAHYYFPYLLVLIFDCVLAKLFSRTLFSLIDLRGLQGKPLVNEVIYFGYFQKGVGLSEIRDSRHVVLKLKGLQEKLQKRNVIHIRGGDFIKYGSELAENYYQLAIKKMIENIGSRVDLNFLVVTNDVDYATKIMNSAFEETCYEIVSNDELMDYQVLHEAKNLVCSNSTFAMTAGLTGSNIEHIVMPKEFLNKFDKKSPLDGINVDFI